MIIFVKMHLRCRSFYIGLVLLSGFFTKAEKMDSLKNAYARANSDTIKCKLLGELIDIAPSAELPGYNLQLQNIAQQHLRTLKSGEKEYNFYRRMLANSMNNAGYLEQLKGNTKKALAIYKEGLHIQKEIRHKKGETYALNSIGFLYHQQGDFNTAMTYYQKALVIAEEIADIAAISQTCNNIGGVYKMRGQIPKAIEYYHRALSSFESMQGRSREVAQSLTNLAVLYAGQGETEKAIENLNKAMALMKKIGNRNGEAAVLNNLAAINYKIGKTEIALEQFKVALKIREEIGDKRGLANSLTKIGATTAALGKNDESLEYYEKALGIAINIHDKPLMNICHLNMGTVFKKKNNIAKALDHATKSMHLSHEMGAADEIADAAKLLFTLYKLQGNYKSSLENYELYIKMNDSINSDRNRKATIRSQLKYEYEKQAAADSVAHAKENEIKSAELSRQSAEIRAKKNQQYALFGGLGLVMIFTGFMYNRFKITQKQKNIIEHQKEIVEEQKKLVEEKQKEILDSIHYAKRIQLALLPSLKRIEMILNRYKK